MQIYYKGSLISPTLNGNLIDLKTSKKILLFKYTFDKSVYDNLIPEFNKEFTNYDVIDDNNEGNIVTRSIYSEEIPSLISFDEGITPNMLNRIISQLPSRTDSYGEIYVDDIYDMSTVNKELGLNKKWHVFGHVTVRYKFNTSTATMPTFNEGFNYKKTDIVNSDSTTTRVIESDEIPTKISFQAKKGLTEVTRIDTRELNTCYGMFYNCVNLTYVRMTDVSKVESMEGMFNNCTKLKKIEGLEKWDTVRLTNLGSTFKTIRDENLDVSHLIVNNVHSMGGVVGNTRIEEIDFSTWQTPYLSFCDGVVQACSKLTKADLSNFDTGRIISMKGLFQTCSSLEEANLSNWIIDASKLEAPASNVFGSCNKLNKITMHNSNSDAVNQIINNLPTKTSSAMGSLDVTIFDDVNSLNIEAANSKFWNVTVEQKPRQYKIASYRFDNTKANLFPVFNEGFEYSYTDSVKGTSTYRNIWSHNLPTSVKFGSDSVGQAAAESLILIGHCDFSEVSDFSNMFKGCKNLRLCTIPAFVTNKTTTLASMFENCENLIKVTMDDWDLSNIEDYSNMFKGCTNLEILHLTTIDNYYDYNYCNINIDNGKNPNVSGFLEGCSSLEGVIISAKDLNYIAAELPDRTLFNPLYPILTHESNPEEVNHPEINKHHWYITGYDYLDLYVMMGQSNMQGQSDIAREFNVPDYQAVTYLYNTDEIAQVKHPFGENIQTLGTYEELGYYQLEGAVGCETGEPWGSLSPHFAASCYEQTKVPMLMVQCARGATTMKDWLPGTKQQRYEIALEKIQKSIDAIQTRLNRPIRRKHLVWLQGESDGVGTSVGTKCATYKTRFLQFWTAIKEACGFEACLMIRVGKFREGYSYNCIPIIEAQEQLANENEDIIMITRITGYLQYREQNPENPTLQHAFQGYPTGNHDHYTWTGYKLVGETAGSRVGEYINTGIMPPLEPEPYSDVNSIN